jgi:hypothetical protein
VMAQQVESEADTGKAGAPGNPAIEKQVFKTTASITAATGGVLNSYAEAALADQLRKTQSLHKSAHRAKGVAEKRYSAVDDEAIDAVGGHAAADARLGLKDQRFEASILQPECSAEASDASADNDHVRVAAVDGHRHAP